MDHGVQLVHRVGDLTGELYGVEIGTVTDPTQLRLYIVTLLI